MCASNGERDRLLTHNGLSVSVFALLCTVVVGKYIGKMATTGNETMMGRPRWAGFSPSTSTALASIHAKKYKEDGMNLLENNVQVSHGVTRSMTDRLLRLG